MVNEEERIEITGQCFIGVRYNYFSLVLGIC